MRFIFISSLMLLFLICFVYSQNVNDQTITRNSISRRGINDKKSRNFLLDIRKRDALPLPIPQAPGAPAPAPPKEPAKGPAKEPAKGPAKEPAKGPAKDPAPAPPKNPAPAQPAPAPPKNPEPAPPKNPAPAQPKQPQPKQPQQPPPQAPQPQPQPPQPQPPQAPPSTVIVTATATGEIEPPSVVPTVRPYNADEHGSADKLKFYQGNSWIIIFMVTNFLFFALL